MTARKQAGLYQAETDEWCSRIGGMLIARRRTLGLTQAGVGERLGLSQRLVANMERSPDEVHVGRLLATLHLYGYEVLVQPLRAPRLAPLATAGKW